MKKIIYGYGITGKSLKKYFDYNNIDYYIVDKKNSDDFVMNIDDFDLYHECDEVFVSPGIPLNNPFIEKCRIKNLKISSEIEKAYSILNKSIFIAVTGTNGKSTVCSLIYEIIKEKHKNVYLCGNFGIPLIDFWQLNNQKNIFVIELSSYQLESLKTFKPYISILINLTPDHLDRHITIDNYRLIKEKIYQNMDNGFLLYNSADFSAKKIDSKVECNKIGKDFNFKDNIFFDNDIVIKDLKTHLLGKHNFLNIAYAVEAAIKMGISIEIIRKVLSEFKGLEHRIEYCGEYNNVKFYNDSKSTTFESTFAALSSFSKPVNIIICGNLKKGMNIGVFIQKLLCSDNIKTVFTVGGINDFNDKIDFMNLKRYKDYKLKDIFEEVLNNSQENEILLFSPGMPSFDNFKNFEERGTFFKTQLKEFLSEKEKKH
ncbi:MAG: UDP-N-acetylmuramoyl-L-alanine--D-glutamate ligase [Candidatus Muirbacterium halophilum]|nr:UDP-N-acetylmuramoyl-L-alanine--D-glutamate ligase [Candidatus Muirbacterium halophilum]MCK9475426.1 UDP-N-acetylmuramoyl-L-alanine--D-glutamate ligase [Candidatus Muirbacterium halophilum]